MPRRSATGVHTILSTTSHKWERSLRVCHQQEGGRSLPHRDCHRVHHDSCIVRDRRIFHILQSLEGVAPRLSTLLFKFPADLRASNIRSSTVPCMCLHSLLTLITYVTKVSELI